MWRGRRSEQQCRCGGMRYSTMQEGNPYQSPPCAGQRQHSVLGGLNPEDELRRSCGGTLEPAEAERWFT